MNFTKNFERARNITKGCLFAAFGLCVLGLLVNESVPDLAVYIVVASVALIAIALFVVFTCLKCPYCGKQIISKCLTATVCPHCRRDLTTGMKSKKKKR